MKWGIARVLIVFSLLTLVGFAGCGRPGIPSKTRGMQSEDRPGRALYSFSQLEAWYEKLSPVVLSIPGVVLTDNDEVRKRLVVGIEKEDLRTRRLIEEQLDTLGIPRQAVLIEVTGPNLPLNHSSAPTKRFPSASG